MKKGVNFRETQEFDLLCSEPKEHSNELVGFEGSGAGQRYFNAQGERSGERHLSDKLLSVYNLVPIAGVFAHRKSRSRLELAKPCGQKGRILLGSGQRIQRREVTEGADACLDTRGSQLYGFSPMHYEPAR